MSAQDAEPESTDPPPPQPSETPVIGPTGPSRFATAPSDVGALLPDNLSPAEREATEVAQSILDTEQPPESVAGWSAVSQQAAEQAAIRRAAYEAGTTGMEDLGVE